MDLQERYDELDNIDRSLDVLIDDIKDKYFIDALNEIRYEAQNEMKEIEPRLQEQYDREQQELENEYWRSQF